MAIEVQENVNLAPFSTIKVGGPAQYFAVAKSREDLIEAVNWARTKKVMLTVLGWASNSLISDNGLPGLVVINKSSKMSFLTGGFSEIQVDADPEQQKSATRLEQADPENYYDFGDLDYDESTLESIILEAESGMPWQMLINQSIANGATGLQFFAGIPGTVGGAVFNNMHGGTHFVKEFVTEVEVIDLNTGVISWLQAEQLEFDYDYSRFHRTAETILQVRWQLRKGDKNRARATAIEWAKRKKLQPARSLGCMWQNLTTELQHKHNFLSNSMGYVVDQQLGLKGKQIGGAKVSEAHAAFIETTEGAKAADVHSLLMMITAGCEEKFGFTPKLEIILKGEF